MIQSRVPWAGQVEVWDALPDPADEALEAVATCPGLGCYP